MAFLSIHITLPHHEHHDFNGRYRTQACQGDDSIPPQLLAENGVTFWHSLHANGKQETNQDMCHGLVTSRRRKLMAWDEESSYADDYAGQDKEIDHNAPQ